MRLAIESSRVGTFELVRAPGMRVATSSLTKRVLCHEAKRVQLTRAEGQPNRTEPNRPALAAALSTKVRVRSGAFWSIRSGLEHCGVYNYGRRQP